MCGIYALISDNIYENNNTDSLKSRSPDNYNKLNLNFKHKLITLEHYRLHINGDFHSQPIYNKEHDIYLLINGEIFNYKDLEEFLNYKTTTSDCEILIPLYLKYKYNLSEFFNKINGQYSFILLDLKLNKMLISRDHIGITSLYYGYSRTGLVFSSRLDTINKKYNSFPFPPRCYIYTSISNPILKFDNYIDFNTIKSTTDKIDTIHYKINNLLTNSVNLRLNSLNDDIQYGFLLSGGLDSSLICSIASKLLNKKIKTFSVGLNENSIDLVYANQVASYLNTEHYNFYITTEEIEEYLPKIITIVETYDTTTIRASLAMYLLIKKIKEKFPEIKVLFSGELSDELFCYLYGSNCPNKELFQQETLNLVNNVYLFDCLRADKTSMENSIEIRVPFTDINFVKYVISIPPELKQFGNNDNMEKQILRDSFNTSKLQNYLPYEILYRKKEQFSDGVSTLNKENMIDIIKNYCYNYVNKNNIKNKIYTVYNNPETDEEYYYMDLFLKQYKEKTIFFIKKWTPKWSNTKDPSGRLQIFWSN